MHFCADEARALVAVAAVAVPLVPRVRRFFAELGGKVASFFRRGERRAQLELEAEKLNDWLRNVAPSFIRRVL